jgi:hypothetical protein
MIRLLEYNKLPQILEIGQRYNKLVIVWFDTKYYDDALFEGIFESAIHAKTALFKILLDDSHTKKALITVPSLVFFKDKKPVETLYALPNVFQLRKAMEGLITL